MAREIERKFRVKGDVFKREAYEAISIMQGFLNSEPERTVRIRIKGDKGFITIKGLASEGGLSRYEWEKEIALEDARELLLLCEPGMIDKTRYLVRVGDYTFEVDEFHGDNQGLVIAEVELPDEDAPFERPAWLGEEVTGDLRYYNSMLAKHPFKMW